MKSLYINAGTLRIAIFSIFFLIISSLQTARAQNFEQAYGSIYDEEATHIIPAYDGGYLMTGSTFNSASAPGTSYDIILVKTDAAGNLLWSKTIGSALDDESAWIEPYADSTYLICGNTYDNNLGVYDDFVIRVDLSGSIISQKIYNINHGERAFCVRKTNDGGYVVAGETNLGGSDLQFHLFKTDTAGTVLWSKAFGDNEQQSASYVQQTNDHGYIVCGTSRLGFTWSSIFIVKTDSSGNFQWSNKYNTQPFLSKCDVSRVSETADGGYLVSGATTANQPLKSVVLMKIDSAGSVVWSKLYGTGQGERNSDILVDGNNYVLCGSTASASGYDDLLLMSTDSAGNLLWNLAFGVQDSNTLGNSMLKSADQRYMIAGMTDTYGAGVSDFFLMKTDSSYGNGLCNVLIPEIVQDTVTLVATAYFASSTETTVDTNGSFSEITGITVTPICSQPTGMAMQEDPHQFRIEPNPAGDKFSIPNLQFSINNIEIFNSIGKRIFYRQDVSDRKLITIDISTFPQGIYTVASEVAGRKYFSKLVVVR